MSRRDLTRWNRAGLSRFRYIDGNAATYLETLRSALRQRFSQWQAMQDAPVSEGEIAVANGRERESLARKRQQQLLQNYQRSEREYGWLIARSLARACHVLTEYADAYANESSLGTATQWDHVRRLVAMLDYHPAPPASASTMLVLTAKDTASGDVVAGFQVKYAPKTGGAPVIFETLDDITIDSTLNLLYPRDWNRSQVITAEAGGWIGDGGEALDELDMSAGDGAILLNEETQQAVILSIAGIDFTVGSFQFRPPGFGGQVTWKQHQVSLLTGARDVRAVRINGEGVIGFDQSPNLEAGDVIAWDAAGWRTNEVAAVDGRFIRLADPGKLPGVGTRLYRLHAIGADSGEPYEENGIVFPLVEDSVPPRIVRDANGLRELQRLDYDKKKPSESSTDSYNVTKAALKIETVYLHLSADKPIRAIPTQVNPADFSSDGVLRDFIVPGAPKGLRSGDWVIGTGGSTRYALQIESIEERSDDFIIRFQSFEAGSNTSIIAIGATLHDYLRRLQVALDETRLAEATLDLFISGDAAEWRVESIQGVGTKYGSHLRKAKVINLRQLRDSPLTSVKGISAVRFAEFKTKAAMVLDFIPDDEARALSASRVYDLLEQAAPGGGGMASVSSSSPLEYLHGPLRYRLRPKNHDRNETTLPATTRIELDSIPHSLSTGREVILVCEDQVLVSEVSEIDESAITLRDPVPAGRFVSVDTRLYGNIVRAGHGERKPEKILGSGDATQSNQSFVLAVSGVSFVPDATMATGVRADIDLRVDTQTWTQVASLKDSSPTDSHYSVRMTEEGYLRIQFGDGSHGRRLPTGNNNLRVGYRLGSGVDGNLPPQSLLKPLKPHAWVKSVSQPMAATGGNAMEDAASLRDNAPATVLTLERAVSISDFARLAASHSSVWQANAFPRAGDFGRDTFIEVVVVPAGGGELGDLASVIEDFLAAHALPGVRISVTPFEALLPQVEVTLHIDSDQFEPAVVEAAVRRELLANFSLQRRLLGQNLYLSEIYAVVENVTGVARSICNLNLAVEAGWQEQRVVQAGSNRHVVYVTDALLVLHPSQEYQL